MHSDIPLRAIHNDKLAPGISGHYNAFGQFIGNTISIDYSQIPTMSYLVENLAHEAMHGYPGAYNLAGDAHEVIYNIISGDVIHNAIDLSAQDIMMKYNGYISSINTKQPANDKKPTSRSPCPQ